jgi:hypothetical protein
MRELWKWLQGLLVGLGASAAQAVIAFLGLASPSAPTGTWEWFVQVAALTALTRLVGWVVGKLPRA